MYYKKNLLYSCFALLFFLQTFFSPVGVFAQASTDSAAYNPGVYTDTGSDTPSGTLIPCTNECDFNDIMQLINNLINFSIEFLVLPIFIAILIYAGFLYLTANGKPGVHAKVRKMLLNALLGLLIVLCSWLIVKVLITTLGYKEGLKFLE
ncbi:MAG TPA: hypothetical protein VLB02_01505 [Candidatus Paceibacterota bacterium]|nr:hypothetical protein [Candidatus Paceibacterota bacterium]